ncbi:MAG: glycoside hydrolase family 5 protein [Mobilitalea sp.]
MRQRNKMNRIIAFALILVLLFSYSSNARTIDAKTKNNNSTYTLYDEFRITVDGTVYQTKTYISQKNEVYVTSSAAKKLLGKKPSDTVKINGKEYASLSKYAKQCKVAFYEYDKVMKAFYIWTKNNNNDNYSDENRIKYYALGTPSERQITYKEFFKLLDKTIKIADSKKLTKWKSMLKEGRTSGRKMTRVEGMMAILYAAATLGADYSEFNIDWSRINNEIGERCWDEIEQIQNTSNPYQYLKNSYPYDLGGFKKSEFVYDGWDLVSVAYRYSFGRSSLLNQKTLFDYDAAKKTMHLGSYMTYSDALNALSRFLDSVERKATEKQYSSLSDQQAVSYDPSIITSDLLEQAKNMPKIKDGDVSDWCGFILNGASYENREIDANQFDNDAKYMSEWGFSCVRYMITYQSIFDKRVTKVDETKLKKLDRLVASAIKYNIHLNLVTFTIPGRWSDTDQNTYTSTGEFDLFTNKDRQKEAYAVWDLLAKRYQNIPSSVLSFCPLWEAQNYNLSTGLQVEAYSPGQVATVYEKLVSTIKKYGNDRLVIYEPTANNDVASIVREAKASHDAIQGSYPNVQMITNFCEGSYVYAEMTAVGGEHIDNNNHSMFKPGYPTTIHAAKYCFRQNEYMEFNGSLVKGTTLKLYLSKVEGNGRFRVTGDGKELYSEQLSTKNYKTGSPLSRNYPYAKSDKWISITLVEKVDNLRIEYSGDYWEWSGIEVTLPKEYEIKRWWNTSGYDLFLEGKKETLSAISPKLKATSNIIISPNSSDSGEKITIHSDISFTSNAVIAQSNKGTINQWGDEIAKFASSSLVRCEAASFCIGTDLKSALSYYEDFLDMCKKNKLGWLSNDYDAIIANGSEFARFKFGGAKSVPYDDRYLLVELLRLYQKHATKPKAI